MKVPFALFRVRRGLDHKQIEHPVSDRPNPRKKPTRLSMAPLRSALRLGLLYLILLLALAWTFFPFWCALVLSIKHEGDFFQPKYVPFLQFQPTLKHWLLEWRTFGEPYGLGRGLLNSVIVATLTTVVSLTLGGLAAFGLRLIHGERRPVWPVLALFLLPQLVPPMVVIIPYSMMMRWLGLEDTRLALVFVHTTLALPLAVMILYSVVTELPGEILDAARVDGCGLLATLRWVVVPFLLPALIGAGILCYAQSWNEFFFALINARYVAWTAPLSIASLITKDGIEFEYVGSHLLLVMLPLPLVILLARRWVVRGLSLGILKEEEFGS
jgi:multiple sugar transport system permease protein